MSKFKVGDRVNVYAGDFDTPREFGSRVLLAEIMEIADEFLKVKRLHIPIGFLKNIVFEVHPKQCRKLVKKKADAPQKQSESLEDIIIHNVNQICDMHFENLKQRIDKLQEQMNMVGRGL